MSCHHDDAALKEKISSLENEVSSLKSDLATAQEDETDFIHTVFFWYKDGVSEKDKATFLNSALPELAKVESIHKLYYGPPAMTNREVVDNSYDIAWICHFKSAEDEAAYQVDPIHTAFVEQYNHLWKKVQVYDNLLSD